MSNSADPPNQHSLLEPGAVLAGKYRVERVLGEGGMGLVLQAYHLQLDERVAIKVPRQEMLAHPDAITRFLREARSAVKIKSEYVARVNDVGTLENGLPYIVMEFLEGEDLSQWLKRRGPLPVSQAVEFLLQVCEALAEAHALGIIHRDLKPPNLFCIRRSDAQYAVKVLDFGISKSSRLHGNVSNAHLTQMGVAMGSPLYMSPEQSASSRDVDARSDIWALGVILYEVLVGHPPFNAESLQGLGMKIALSAPDSLTRLRPEVLPELEQVVFRCLEKRAEDRFPNVAELAVALLPFGPKHLRSSVGRTIRVIQSAGLSRSALDLPPSDEAGKVASPSQRPVTGPSITLTALPPGPNPSQPEPSSSTLGSDAHPGFGAVSERPGSGTGGTQAAFEHTPSLPLPQRTHAAWLGAAAAALVGTGAWLMLRYTEPKPSPDLAAAVSSQEPGLGRPVEKPAAVSPIPPQLAESPPKAASSSVLGSDDAPTLRLTQTSSTKNPGAETAVVQSSLASTTSQPAVRLLKTNPTPAKAAHPAGAAAPVAERPPPPASVNCTPPFTVDARGRKHFKSECFK